MDDRSRTDASEPHPEYFPRQVNNADTGLCEGTHARYVCTTNVVQEAMGLRSARGALIAALEAGDLQHEARDTLSEKNLLAVGEVSEADVIALLRRTRGDQYSSSGHDWDPATTVHVFRPDVDDERWYIKAYFLDPTGSSAVFISVHK